MGNIFGFFFLAFAGLIEATINKSDPGYTYGGGYEIVPQDYLEWKFTYMNKNCSYPGWEIVCMDIRMCRDAAATLAMGGWPVLCGWVGKGVPKVCCGRPLVLGKTLMEKIDEENARGRRCGTREFKDVSSTSDQFYKILRKVRDVPFPDAYDPPLAETEYSPNAGDPPVGGKPTRQGYFSWMVSIRKAGKHWCGGTLIDRSHILTAAHCFTADPDQRTPDPSEYVVHVGNIYVEEGFPFSIKKIVLHPRYEPPYIYHDLAILTLTEEILSPHVAHICLPSSEMAARDLTGENTTLLGWGHTEFEGNSTPILHIVDSLPVVPFQECKRAYRRVSAYHLPRGLTEDFMCAGLKEGGKDACQSDSGGPLMYTNDRIGPYPYILYVDIPWTQVGIVSYGFRCGDPGFPGIYIKVANYLDWITKTMKE